MLCEIIEAQKKKVPHPIHEVSKTIDLTEVVSRMVVTRN
jgi:hypothetical protein